MESISPYLFAFTCCLMVAFLFSEFFHRFQYPRVLGYILSGVFIGSPYVSGIFLPDGFVDVIDFLSEVGIVFFILLAGTEIDVRRLIQMSTVAVLVGFLSFILPLSLGTATMLLFGYGLVLSLVVGLCLSVTAAAIAVEILMEYGLLKTKDGSVIVGAGMVDDFLGVIALSVILMFLKVGQVTFESVIKAAFMLIVEYAAFLFIALTAGFFVYPHLAGLIWKRRGENQVFTLSLIFGLIITFLSQVFGLSSIIGAFIAGLTINLTLKHRREGADIVNSLEVVTFGLVIPFFFISVGLRLNISNLFSDMPLLLALSLIGALGKYAGVYTAGYVTKLPKPIVNIVGLGMNCRGGIELIIASVALSQGILSKDIFSIIVSIAFITTFAGLYFFKKQVRENAEKLDPIIDRTLKEGVRGHKRLTTV